ncbi:MAG: hypothetical protein H6746_20470 [Deltaproteobacteria bacterium]|nr:hypothetical protein [Deltaproteobacteria bacterium]
MIVDLQHHSEAGAESHPPSCMPPIPLHIVITPGHEYLVDSEELIAPLVRERRQRVRGEDIRSSRRRLQASGHLRGEFMPYLQGGPEEEIPRDACSRRGERYLLAGSCFKRRTAKVDSRLLRNEIS